jgi:hypothetical protein
MGFSSGIATALRRLPLVLGSAGKCGFGYHLYLVLWNWITLLLLLVNLSGLLVVFLHTPSQARSTLLLNETHRFDFSLNNFR